MVPAFNSSFLIFRPSLTFLDTAVWERSAMISPSFQAQVHQVSSFWGIWQDHLQSMTPLLPWSSKPSLEPCFQWWSSSCLPSVTRLQKFCHPSSDHPPRIIWVGKDWEIKQGRAPNGQVPTLAKLGSKLLVWKGTCFEQLRFAVLLQLHVLQSKEARGSHTHTDTHTRGRYFESKTQYQVLHYSDYLDVVGWQQIM